MPWNCYYDCIETTIAFTLCKHYDHMLSVVAVSLESGKLESFLVMGHIWATTAGLCLINEFQGYHEEPFSKFPYKYLALKGSI
jgi:hypothetical protein